MNPPDMPERLLLLGLVLLLAHWLLALESKLATRGPTRGCPVINLLKRACNQLRRLIRMVD